MLIPPEPLRDFSVVVYAAVAQERPPASYLFAVGDVDLDNDALLFGVRRLVENFALRSSHEGSAPELYASGASGGVWLVSYAVDSYHRQSVSHGMSTLYSLPCPSLSLLFLRSV